MSIFNHFGISNLYFSTVNKKSVHFFYARDCVVFMDALNVVTNAKFDIKTRLLCLPSLMCILTAKDIHVLREMGNILILHFLHCIHSKTQFAHVL